MSFSSDNQRKAFFASRGKKTYQLPTVLNPYKESSFKKQLVVKKREIGREAEAAAIKERKKIAIRKAVQEERLNAVAEDKLKRLKEVKIKAEIAQRKKEYENKEAEIKKQNEEDEKAHPSFRERSKVWGEKLYAGAQKIGEYERKALKKGFK